MTVTVVDVFKANDIISQLKEIATDIDSENERAEHHETIAQTLDVIQSNYYLVPKIVVKEDKLVDIEAPEHALEQALTTLWAEV